MRHLEKVICTEVTKKNRQDHRDIQSHPHLYLNSSFKLIRKPKFNFDELGKECFIKNLSMIKKSIYKTFHVTIF